MRSLILSILGMLLFLSLYGQERISNYRTNLGSNKVHFIRTIDDVHYFIEVDQDNQMTVSELNGVDEKALLHTQTFQGIYANIDLMFVDNYLVFASGADIVEYDFVNNVVIQTPIPDGLNVGDLRSRDGHRILVTLRDDASVYKNSMLYDIGGEVHHLDRKILSSTYGDEILTWKYRNDTVDYFIYNFKTGIEDTLVKDCNFQQYVVRDEDSILYFDADGMVRQFDMETRQSSSFHNLSLTSDARSRMIILGDEHIVLIATDNGTSVIRTYDRADLSLISDHTIALEDRIYPINGHVSGNRFIGYMDNTLLVLDLLSGDYIVRPTLYGTHHEIPIVEGDLIINPTYSRNAQNQLIWHFESIDISDLSYQAFDEIYDLGTPNFSGFSRFGDKIVAAFRVWRDGHHTLFTFDLDDMTSEVNKTLDESVDGFMEASGLLKLNTSLFLIADSLYTVTDVGIEPFFSREDIQEINYSLLKIRSDEITFIQNSPKLLMAHDGKELKTVMDIEKVLSLMGSQFVYDYAVTDEYVLIVTNSSRYLIDRTTEVVKEISNGFINVFFDRVFSHQQFIYYSNGNQLYRTDGSSDPELILDDLFYGSFLQDAVHFLFKEELLVVTESGLVRIEDDGTVTQLSSAFDPSEFSLFVMDNSGEHLLVEGRNKKLHYNGDDVYELELQHGDNTFVNATSEGVFLIEEYDNSTLTNTYYDPASRTYGLLPDMIQPQKVIDYFVSQDEYFLLSIQGYNPYDRLYIYKTDEVLSELELVEEYQDVGYLFNAFFTKFYDEGFLYSGNNLFFVDEQNEFTLIEELKGSRGQTTVIDHKNMIFFIAIDPIYGRQLFKMELQSFRSSTGDISTNYFKIYPNPTTQSAIIQYDGLEANSDYSIMIYDSEGGLISEYKSVDSMDVSSLTPGMYHVRFTMGDHTEVHKFIKI